MKEIIYHVVASTPGRVISIAVGEVLTKDNILGIINKTTGKVLYTPLKYPLLTFGLSAGTLTLTLDSSIPSISVGDHLLIKIYSDASSDLVAAFFNITEATEYTALTPAEAIAIARDCQYNVMGTDWPIPTWLPTGVTEAQVESAAEGLGIPYHEPTQTA